jgi:hypothetical protein
LAQGLLYAWCHRFILMTRTQQFICRTACASFTKAVQQSCCSHMRPVVARWSKFIDAGCLA